MISLIKKWEIILFSKVLISIVFILEFVNKFYKPNGINIQGLTTICKKDVENYLIGINFK